MSFNVHKLFSAAARNGVNYAFMPHARREYGIPSIFDALAAFDLWPRARAPHSMPQNLWQLGKLLLQIAQTREKSGERRGGGGVLLPAVTKERNTQTVTNRSQCVTFIQA